MRYELNIYQADKVRKVSVEVGDLERETVWPVMSENPLSRYLVSLVNAPVLYDGKEQHARLSFDIRSFQLGLSFSQGETHKVLESLDVQQLRRHFLRTLLLKWREEQTPSMSHDAVNLYRLAQVEVRRLEGR